MRVHTLKGSPIVLSLLLFFFGRAQGAVVQWDFNGNLDPTTGSGSLTAEASPPATQPEVTFETVSINDRDARAAHFSRGTVFRVVHNFPPNGGGAYVNRYTVVMDVMFPDRSPSNGWAALWQTNLGNSNDGDWFVNPSGGIGISGNYGGAILDGEWHRLALVVDLVGGTYTGYIDGEEVQQNTGLALDGRFSLYAHGDPNGNPPAALVFADDDSENTEGFVNSLQIRDSALTGAAIAALGGPSAEGIPVDIQPPEQGMIARWIFDEIHVSGQTAMDGVGERHGRIQGTVRLEEAPPCLVLDGKTNYVTFDDTADPDTLPQKNITVEAWVSLEATAEWGGILGYVQDNGDFEKGWLLGYRDTNFTMALSTDGSLTYLSGNASIVTGRWYHVVGTYDGISLKLYVDGKLDAVTSQRRGDIDYAPARLTLGAYRDDNELYPMDGRIHEVRLYNKTLSSQEVRSNYESKRDLFPAGAVIAVGPFVRFTGPDSAVFTWETDEPTPSIIEYGTDEALGTRAEDPEAVRVHEITVTGLEPDTPYFYRVYQEGDLASKLYEFSTEFNYKKIDVSGITSPYPEDDLTPLYAVAARAIIETTGVTKGYCLDYGCGKGRLAFEIAGRSELSVLGVTDSAEEAREARRLLKESGVYGARITIHVREDLASLPYPGNCFNLIVSDTMVSQGKTVGSAVEVGRLLRPLGGTALLGEGPVRAGKLTQEALEEWIAGASLPYDIVTDGGALWARVVRGPLEGAGEWTHMYGDPGQTASSHDMLVAGSSMKIQWFGRPGARGMIDRQSRNMSPLWAGGRLYIQGDNRLFALDGYNGTILWTLETADLIRVNIPRDCGHLCADDDNLYAAVRNACLKIDGQRGDVVDVFPVQSAAESGNMSWGYIAVVGDLLFGSAVKPNAHYVEFKGRPYWYDETSGGFGTAQVVSDSLFALRKEDGGRQWTYKNGVILNSSIAIGGGRMYFVECREPSILAEEVGRIGSSRLWEDQYLVALDIATGEKIWEKSVSFPHSPTPVVFYLCYWEETLVVSMTTTRYHLFAFSAEDGADRWTASHAWNRNHHGGHMYHPIVLEDMVIVEPRVYDISNGGVKISNLPPGRVQHHVRRRAHGSLRQLGLSQRLILLLGRRLRPENETSRIAGELLVVDHFRRRHDFRPHGELGLYVPLPPSDVDRIPVVVR